ncbi:barstar family protein [Chryseobacterium sp. CT-SW4]|uniref:hypothetical protein n=1 Tax=Chryseobacterium sp. SW-1 TaxID=3157343 RepID=UPI003B028E87
MEIDFLLEEKKILSTQYIKLVYKKDFDKITIKKDHVKYTDLSCKEIFDKDIIIRVSFKNFKNDYVFNLSNILIKAKEIVLIGILNDPLGIYNQGYIDNFKLLTDKKERIKWYELNDKQKYYYLRGCGLLSGVRETIDNRESIITIDLSKVKTDLDVYYEIGKAFFTSYGYFGTEFHSFRDCLYNINELLRKQEFIPTLKIKGAKSFEKNFSDNILYSDFYEEFKKSGFAIVNN